MGQCGNSNYTNHMKNILLIGEYYSANLGDPLLCRVVQKTIVDAFPETNIVPFDISGKIGWDTSYTTKHCVSLQLWFNRLEYRLPTILNSFTLFRVINMDSHRYFSSICLLDSLLSHHSFDCAVFAGGSIFMDYFSGVIWGILKRLDDKKIPTVFHACGMSHFTDDTQAILSKALLRKNIKSISLRDSFTKFNELFQLSINQEITETYDTALVSSKYFTVNSGNKIDIGIGIIGIDKYYELQREIVSSVMRSGKSWHLFTNGSLQDFDIALKILAELGINKREFHSYIYDSPKNVDELICNINSFNRIISFRMHSQIIATSYGIPSFGFIWDSKVKEFYEKIGFPMNCQLPEEIFRLEEVIDRLEIDSSLLRHRARNLGEESQQNLIKQLKKLNVEALQ